LTKKGFLLGIPTAYVVGVPLSFYNAILATMFGVAIGAMIGGSKKSGGAIGLLCSPMIYLAPLYIPLLAVSRDVLFIILVVGGSLLYMFTTIVIIIAMIVGIIVGHLMTVLERKKHYEVVEEGKVNRKKGS